MIIKRLNLINFRNYKELHLEFSLKPTIFIGPNGAGKSNILEAIYLLSTSKSPRVDSESELISFSENAASVEGIFKEDNDETNLLITIVNDPKTPFKKRYSVNGVNRRVTDFIGNFPGIIFWPSDINLITQSPSLRRWHLDIALAQVNSSYKRALTIYGDLVTSRNRVLKRIREGEGKVDELDFWTDELLKNAVIIIQERAAFFEFANKTKNPLGDYSFDFFPSFISKEKLQETISREIAAATTLIGPHRDDFGFKFKGEDMSKYGSRGEQRMATLAFKLAQLEYMSSVLKKRPVLLLDDVFSELDVTHRAEIARISNLQQTIISTVELENIPDDFLKDSNLIKIEEGRISRD